MSDGALEHLYRSFFLTSSKGFMLVLGSEGIRAPPVLQLLIKDEPFNDSSESPGKGCVWSVRVGLGARRRRNNLNPYSTSSPKFAPWEGCPNRG